MTVQIPEGWEIHIMYPVPLYNSLTAYPDGDTFGWIVPHFREMIFSDVIGDTGSGQVTFVTTGNFLATFFANTSTELMAVVKWRGVTVFRWITEETEVVFANEGDQEICTISGRGYGCLLEISAIIPEGYPGTYDPDAPLITHWNFENTTPAEIFIQLLGYTRESFGIPPGDISATSSDYFYATFNETLDSFGVAWDHTIDFDLSPGGDMLQLLRRMSEAAASQWHVNADKQIDMAPVLGVDRSEEVSFHLGSHFKVGKIKVDRKAVAFYINTLGQNGFIGSTQPGDLAETPNPLDAIGWRQLIVDTANATTLETAQKFSELLAQSHMRPRVSVTIKVFRGFRHEPYVDFGIGDLIHLDFGSEVDFNGSYQVAAITVKVNALVGEEIELTLVSKSQLLAQRLQLEIERQTRGMVRAQSELQVSRNISADGTIVEPPPTGGGGSGFSWDPAFKSFTTWILHQGTSDLSTGSGAFASGGYARIGPATVWFTFRVRARAAGTAGVGFPIYLTNQPSVFGSSGGSPHLEGLLQLGEYSVINSVGAAFGTIAGHTGVVVRGSADQWELSHAVGNLGDFYSMELNADVVISGTVQLTAAGVAHYEFLHPSP